METEEAVRKPSVGRTPKFDEESKRLSALLPMSLYAFLETVNRAPTDATIHVIEFYRDLLTRLEDVTPDLIMSAATHEQEFSQSRAETLARLVKLGLAYEKKTRK